MASKEGQTNQTALSNIWKQPSRIWETGARSIEAGHPSQLWPELEGLTFQHLPAA